MRTVPFNEEDWKKGREVRRISDVGFTRVLVRHTHNRFAWVCTSDPDELIVPIDELHHSNEPLDVPGNAQGLSAWTIGTHEGWRVVGPDEECPEDVEFFCGITWMKSNRVRFRCDSLTYRTKAPKPIELPYDQLVWVKGKDYNPYTWCTRSSADFHEMRRVGVTRYRIGNGPWMEVPK